MRLKKGVIKSWSAVIGGSLCLSVYSQTYKFRQYGIEQGVCHHTIYAVEQDRNGFVWFATGTGLCRFDGFHFTSPEETPADNATVIFKDREENLWFGYNNGTVIKYDGKQFLHADTSKNQTAVTKITQTPQGHILVATQTEGITLISDRTTAYYADGLEGKLIYTILCINDTKLLLGCDDGLYLCNYRVAPFNVQLVSKFEDIGDEAIFSIIAESGSNNFWVLSEYGGLFHLTPMGQDFTARKIEIPDFNEARLQSVYEDTQKNLWISTLGNGLFQVRFSKNHTVEQINNYNDKNGLGSNYIKYVFSDNQQNLWVGTYGHGISCLTNQSILFWEHLDAIGDNVTAVWTENPQEYWMAGNGAIVRIKDGEKNLVLDGKNGMPKDRITALYMDEEETFWIGTEKSGIYTLDKKHKEVKPYYFSTNSLSNSIQAITSLDRKILAATLNGVLLLNTKDRSEKILNNYNGLPYNNIRDIYKDAQNNVWIATNSNAVLTVNHWVDPLQDERRLETGQISETEFTCITADNNGNIWAGTNGAGIFLFDLSNDTVFQFTTQNGMKSDFCYAMEKDSHNCIWVGHRLGLSRVDVNRHSVSVFGIENGVTGDVTPNALQVNSSDELIAGLTNGAMLYRIPQQEDLQKPMLNMTALTVGDKSYDTREPLTLPFNLYRIRFDFIGLQYENPEAITYRYILQGYDTEWSKLSKERSVLYPRLEDGEYTFLVKACNGSVCTDETKLFTLTIRKPFWKTWWFILLMLVITVSGFYAIIRIRERTHRKQQEYLERELAARTKEVLEQKEEIEHKNKDITDSINYAQRIQFSVLPSTKTLLDNCSDAFIFYRPRDIVSGDFYWFDYFPKKNSILVVCADSTGHGVPGAFMSLIGTTLIKDIVMRPQVDSPDKILMLLDENIQSTLNQNQESEQANDGMDVIVCEINMETCHVRVSSAMRPFVVHQNGVQRVFKGSHVSIGGQPVANKVFGLIELDMAPGDSIYMFSDGYPDQFGGPAGKKFKMNRLLNILNDMQHRDMEEQYRVLRENFELWKGEIEQVDDVLVIGIKL
ncbi:MAG: SpoIIE family protein phosphatase [Bacteroidales bacterium]|jgi:ligand-binding sensor domain-containing protein/serine phosphatase RsbU (regulator of sigma subunit)|nr:SpoIIE family protein phosphatase [Bacteroidales bacterium]